MPYDPLYVEAGKLRNRVTLQRSSASPDVLGQRNSTWVPFYSCWASLDQISSKLIFQTGNLSSSVSHKMRIRYPGSSYTISPGNRVVFGSHTYQIVSVDNVQERNIVLEILLLEINGAN